MKLKSLSFNFENVENHEFLQFEPFSHMKWWITKFLDLEENLPRGCLDKNKYKNPNIFRILFRKVISFFFHFLHYFTIFFLVSAIYDRFLFINDIYSDFYIYFMIFFFTWKRHLCLIYTNYTPSMFNFPTPTFDMTIRLLIGLISILQISPLDRCRQGLQPFRRGQTRFGRNDSFSTYRRHRLSGA